MADLRAMVEQDSLSATSEGTFAAVKMNKLGFLVTVDFYTQMALEGRCYQVRAGTVTTPLTGDVAITDTDAEMCADAAAGTTIMPYEAMIGLDGMGGDALEIAGKSVTVVSNVGTAFVPLPLLGGGVAATSTARVDGAGVVQVPAELATNTLQHFHAGAEFVQDSGTETLGMTNPYTWQPRVPAPLAGARCFYIQIESATTGPLYFAHFDYIELPTANIS